MPAASSIAALLSSVLVLIAGNGLLTTLVPMRATLGGFSDLAIGLLGSAYFAGMLAGTLAAPAIISRAGYIRAFAAFSAVAVAITLMFPVVETPPVWVGLRYSIGFVFSGFYALIEAWLTDKSDNSNRGRVYALYQIITFTGTAAGQQVLAFVEPMSAALFSLCAGFYALSMLPMAFTKAEPPPRPRGGSLRLPWLAHRAPTAAVAAFCVGAANGSFWSLATVYGLGLGLSPANVATFMTSVILGTAVAVYPVGKLSDRFDRRKVLLGFALAGGVVEVLLANAGTMPFSVVAALGFAVGATTMVLYMLAVSHANDRGGPENAVSVSSGLLFLYCCGAIVAPLVASALMARFGAQALFAQNAAIHLGLGSFVLGRLLARRGSVPVLQPASLRKAEPGHP